MNIIFRKYTKKEFSALREQHNILALVGNGFDISVLNKYGYGKLKGKSTSYKGFFDYITYFNLSSDSNILYKKMKEEKQKESKNRSNFEKIILDLHNSDEIDYEKIENDIDNFQNLFTKFLNDLVNSDVLLKLNSDVKEKKLALQSLGHFMNDLNIDADKLEFSKGTCHYDLFNYVFVNFNYTSLLENYLYLDKSQFDPHEYKTVDTNFRFYLDTKTDKKDTKWSSYILSEVIHPHGIQDIPRSILFGIDLPEFDEGISKEKRLVKSYWAQYNVKYQSYFNETNLFIIFGMSFGKNDAWWMDNIFDAILNIDRNVELIIYKYGNESDEVIKNLFISSCTRHESSSEEDKEKVKSKIYVVRFEQNDTYFLGLEQLID